MYLSNRAKLIVAFTFLLIALSFSTVNTDRNAANTLLTKYATQVNENVVELNQLAKKVKYEGHDAAELKTAVLAVRNTYKKIEFLVAYEFPDFAEEKLNGAPLLKVKRNVEGASVHIPEGMQVLDEWAYSEEIEELKVDFASATQHLETNFQKLHKAIIGRSFSDVELIEASRQNLIRILTLGITGFDTPGSLNGLEESKISLIANLEFIEPILNENDASNCIALYKNGIEMLEKQTDFGAFDRTSYTKNVIVPLYKKLSQLQKTLKDDRAIKKPSGWNPLSTEIFDDSFLDPYFFAGIDKAEDNEAVRSLGEKLFYDASISANAKMSCASCHNPKLAFTYGASKAQSAVFGETVARNSPTLINAVFADRYFYDLRAFDLKQQTEHVVFNQKEFNTAKESIVNKINRNKDYNDLIKQAFGNKEISSDEFTTAITSYVASLRSYNSEFDQYMRGEKEEIENEIKEGYNLFMGKANCGTCHFAPTFSGLVPPLFSKNESEILGVLDEADTLDFELDEDLGRSVNGIKSESAWIYERSFKTTTVRNVEFTAPYFHNGAYNTLEDVVDFYNHGGGAGLGIEVKNQTLPPDRLGLSHSEKKAIIAFMKSLSDNMGLD
jgi:cytochrome c peroxidase